MCTTQSPQMFMDIFTIVFVIDLRIVVVYFRFFQPFIMSENVQQLITYSEKYFDESLEYRYVLLCS